MKHFKILLGIIVLASAFLTACQAEDSETEKEPKEAVVEEVKSDIPSKEALIALVDQHFDGLKSSLSQAAVDFNLKEGADVTDAIYEAMKASFNNFATASYIEGDLKIIAKNYCYAGCDALYFPYNFAGALNIDLEEISAEEVKLTATHPADMMISSQASKDIVTLKLDGGLWKVDNVDYEETELALTQEQAATIATKWGYTNPKFVEQDDTGYVFETDIAKVRVVKTSGYVEEGFDAAPTPAPQSSDSAGSLYEHYDAKLDATVSETEHLYDTFTGYTTQEMNELSSQVFDLWDGLLNEMYGALKENLPADEFAQLQKEQRQWIKDRDAEAERVATEEAAGGTMYTMIYTESLTESTSQRCADFLFDYMVGL